MVTVGRNYKDYREIADRVEDDYYIFQRGNRHLQLQIDYLTGAVHATSDKYERVANLYLLCQAMRTLHAEMGGGVTHLLEEIVENVNILYKLCDFDPLSISSCALFYFYDIGDVETAARMITYAAFVAERERVLVRHAHQNLVRIVSKSKDPGIMESSVRRLTEYVPPTESPDPSLENDIFEIVKMTNLDDNIKERFLRLSDLPGMA